MGILAFIRYQGDLEPLKVKGFIKILTSLIVILPIFNILTEVTKVVFGRGVNLYDINEGNYLFHYVQLETYNKPNVKASLVHQHSQHDGVVRPFSRFPFYCHH